VKLLYVARLDLGLAAHSGVKNKIESQCLAFQNLGVDSNVLAWYGANLNYNQLQTKTIRKSRLDFYKLYFKYATELIRSEKYDVVWLRFPWFDPYVLSFVRNCKKYSPTSKLLLEIPTFPFSQEVNGITDQIRFLINRFYRFLVAGYIHRVVTYSDHEVIYGLNCTSINNGYSYQDLPQVPKPSVQLNLIAVGNISFWHGYDRILNGMKENVDFVINERVFLHIIGEGEYLSLLRQQVFDNDIPNVVFHGPLYGDKLSAFIQSHSGIGIGSLGTYRKGVYKESALKTREYVRHGLPVLHATRDDGLVNFEFAYRIEEDDSSVNIPKLKTWYNNLGMTADKHEQIQNFGKENLSWENQIKKVLRDIQL
jgi:hypothetical protein